MSLADPYRGLLLRKHKKLLHNMLRCAPEAYSSLETNRMTFLFFILSGLDVLGELDSVVSEAEKAEMIKGIYRMQLTTSSGADPGRCGFRGSLSASAPPKSDHVCPHDSAHIAQTYSALCCLLILGDDLSQVDRSAVLEGVRQCQLIDGSFSVFAGASEADMRFVFCAAAICYILDGFEYIDVDAMVEFIQKSRSYEGGFGQGPLMEAHGGSTYCAIASLQLARRLQDMDVLDKRARSKLIVWATGLQEHGFHGRTNKTDDTCYAFWLGGTLAMMNAQALVDTEALRSFILECEDTTHGGFCKTIDSEVSDVLHTYFGLAALSIFNEPTLSPMYPALNVSMRAYEHLENLKRRRTTQL
uniref:Geranylgeranyl transferase type I subunit beta n=1 Tax=Panagrellus redivivus TaxID=6233 RepID=A0A7E4V684_PANRE